MKVSVVDTIYLQTVAAFALHRAILWMYTLRYHSRKLQFSYLTSVFVVWAADLSLCYWGHPPSRLPIVRTSPWPLTHFDKQHPRFSVLWVLFRISKRGLRIALNCTQYLQTENNSAFVRILKRNWAVIIFKNWERKPTWPVHVRH